MSALIIKISERARSKFPPPPEHGWDLTAEPPGAVIAFCHSRAMARWLAEAAAHYYSLGNLTPDPSEDNATDANRFGVTRADVIYTTGDGAGRREHRNEAWRLTGPHTTEDMILFGEDGRIRQEAKAKSLNEALDRGEDAKP